jgi:hypothetical protein
MTEQNYELMAAGNISGSIQSAPFIANRLIGFSAQCVTVGNAAGTIKLQSTDDAGVIPQTGEHDATGLSNWVDIDESALSVTGQGVYTIDCSERYSKWMRISYEATSGSGTMNIRISGVVRE